jgi:outer membrane protein assembly factor BamE (lipoprotein component of BamABCDE complex)
MNILTKFKFAALITVALLVLAIDGQAQGISIEKGKTTKEEVSKFFGKPFLTKNIGNKECWFYESGDKVLGQKDANYVIYFQFSEKGILEDTYETTKGSIDNIKPRSLNEVAKKDIVEER